MFALWRGLLPYFFARTFAHRAFCAIEIRCLPVKIPDALYCNDLRASLA
jgi:hypothetical protein